MPRRTKDESDEITIKIFKMKVAGKKNNEIAQELNLHPSTVSTKLSKMRKQLKDLDERVQRGDIVLRSTGREQSTALAIPTQNPFNQLQSFSEMAGIVNAGGAVIGSGAAAAVKAFKDESLPYGERMELAMKGGAVLLGSALSIYATIQNLTREAEKPPMKNVTLLPATTTITSEPPETTPTETREAGVR